MSLIARYLVGIPAMAVASAIGTPALGYIVWKGTGFMTTGNPLHLLPGGGLLADVADVADGMDAAGIGLGDSDPGERKHW